MLFSHDTVCCSTEGNSCRKPNAACPRDLSVQVSECHPQRFTRCHCVGEHKALCPPTRAFGRRALRAVSKSKLEVSEEQRQLEQPQISSHRERWRRVD